MRKCVQAVRNALGVIIYLIGAAAISYGAGQIYPPAGWIAAGAAIIALALLL